MITIGERKRKITLIVYQERLAKSKEIRVSPGAWYKGLYNAARNLKR
jgi:hypothetical protein